MGRCLNWTSEEDLTTTLKSNRVEAKTKQKTLIGLEPDGVNTEVREVKGTLMSTRAASMAPTYRDKTRPVIGDTK